MRKAVKNSRLIGLVNKIKRGELESAELVNGYMPPCGAYVIDPAMVLHFNDNTCYPIRTHKWNLFKAVVRDSGLTVADHRTSKPDEYFNRVEVPTGGEYYWRLLKEHSTKLYYVHTSGVVAVRYRNGREKVLTPYLKDDRVCVTVIGETIPIKHLVAKVCFMHYKKGMPVINRDRDIWNNDYKNLIVTTKQKLGRATGHLSRSHKVVACVDGNFKLYRSIRSCAKSLNMSYQTILDYLEGRAKNSVVEPFKVRRISQNEMPKL